VRLACLVCILLTEVTVAMAEKPLLDIAAVDTSTVTLNSGAKVELVKTADGPALRLSAPKSEGSPGFALAVRRASQDLSPYVHLGVLVTNVGAREVRVVCRAENPDASGTDNCIEGSLSLSPGQTGELRVNIRRKKPDWATVDLFGMRGYPWNGCLDGENVPRHLVDPARIVKLVISIPQPAAEQVVDIRSIFAAGEFRQPTRLLADPDRFFPFIDEFGQYMHADWPGKTHSAEELAAAVQVEEKDLAAHPGPTDWDQFGGWKAGPTLKATGSFYAAKHEGKWWLIDPEGKLFFSQGIDCVDVGGDSTPIDERERWFRWLPADDPAFKGCFSQSRGALHGYYAGKRSACFDFSKGDLMRKYGPDWQERFAEVSHRRLRSWGLNTIGNWSSPQVYARKKTPYVVTVNFGGKQLQGSQGYWGKFRDVFDADFRTQVRAAMERRASDSADDPWCIGYFVDNEISWGGDDVALALAALASPPEQVAKQVFAQELKDTYGSIEKLNAAWGTSHASWDALLESTEPPDAVKARADLTAFHARTARTYFQTVRDAVREYAPKKLYLGCRFAWANTPAVAAAAEFCDVVSYNIYRMDISSFRFPVDADVPIIIGEFHMGALDRGMFHTGLVSVDSQEDRAAAYKSYVRSVLRHPQFVGCHWFKYRDEPTTGRPLDEENYQIGFLDIADTPYAETIQAARELGASLYSYRLQGR
jgi:hypothetical protein